MTDKIIPLHGGPVPHAPEAAFEAEPKLVLETAIEARPETVLVLGWNRDGSLYLDASVEDPPALLWLLEAAKRDLMDCYDATEDD